jgi:hypothetical protein
VALTKAASTRVCTRDGCSNPIKRGATRFCSRQCSAAWRHSHTISQEMPLCARDGCSNRIKAGGRRFCSYACSSARPERRAQIAAFNRANRHPRPTCARPGCDAPTKRPDGSHCSRICLFSDPAWRQRLRDLAQSRRANSPSKQTRATPGKRAADPATRRVERRKGPRGPGNRTLLGAEPRTSRTAPGGSVVAGARRQTVQPPRGDRPLLSRHCSRCQRTFRLQPPDTCPACGEATQAGSLS